MNCNRMGTSVLVIAVACSFPMRAMAQCGTWMQRNPISKPSPRSGHAMAYDSARGVTVLFGGFSSGNNGETWEWDGNNWTQRMPASAPTARNGHAMAYDARRGVTVLFGGSTGAANGETWEWDGTDWSQGIPATSPAARHSHAMVYDDSRGVTVLFGGMDGSAALTADTHEWDGTDWTERTPATASPDPRFRHAMAYDASRGVTVLFGGVNLNGSLLNDTHEWDGNNWTKQSLIIVPAGRGGHSMGFDADRGVSIVFGGLVPNNQGSSSTNNETWQWDGNVWANRSLPVNENPTAREGAGMAYDTKGGVIVMFGGLVGANFAPSNESLEWTGPQAFISQQPANQIVAAGQSAAFDIIASSPAAATVRWRKDGIPLTDDGTVIGSATTSLTINPVAVEDAGIYDCIVDSACGSVSSRPAILTVDACRAVDAGGDCNGNRVPDACEIDANAGLDANADGTLDACQPGSADLCVVAAGSDGDCNQNGSLDSCEIAANSALDSDGNEVLDACEVALPSSLVSDAAPCGVSGGGTAAMMPIVVLATTASRRLARRQRGGTVR